MALSRIGKQVIPLPSGVSATVKGKEVEVKGPKGTLTHTLVQASAEVDDKELRVLVDESGKNAKAMHGLARAILNNMVRGVSEGFSKTLLINGVGYRADLSGTKLTLSLGFSHPITYELPKGVSGKVDKQTTIVLESIDKQLLGQVAAEIRGFRPPEPYKGKGVKYSDERIVRKVGKAGVK
jgi:large subunit ribosomal protein L6